MAVWPCLRCAQRFNGEAENLYLSHYVGDLRESFRFVVCPECCEALLDEWRQQGLWRDGDDQWQLGGPDNPPVPQRVRSEPSEGHHRRKKVLG